MPSVHRRYASWTPERIRGRAAATGPNTEILVDVVMPNFCSVSENMFPRQRVIGREWV